MTTSVRSNHRARAQNATKSCLLTVAREQLRIAMHRPDGRSWRFLSGEDSSSGHQAVVALTAGTLLGDALVSTSRAWTAQVLQGTVRYRIGHSISFGWPGDLLIGTGQRHELRADHATVLLLTLLSQNLNALPH